MCTPLRDLCNFRTNTHALHFCDVTLAAKKPLPEAYPKTLLTLGDHLRKRRLDLKLRQIDVAATLEVDEMTICNWEKGLTTPRLYLMPKIIDFMGYDPLDFEVITFGQKIKRYRVERGLSLKKLAKLVDVDPGTIARWERGEVEPRRKLKGRLIMLFKGRT